MVRLRLYRGAKGNTWIIVVLLVTMTVVTSAFLKNVTAILIIVVNVEYESRHGRIHAVDG
jgi:Na+/H+ antiporter NhaD/arsenite permease-like protein